MALIRPVERRHNPPSPQDQARYAAEAAVARANAGAAREALKPAKRAVLAIGPPLRDIEAAVECGCSCHPRPGQPDTHGTGQTCPCQQTAAERKVAMAELFSFLACRGEAEAVPQQRERVASELHAEALRLGVTATVTLDAAPFVITGVCDGRAFYLRERHGTWRVTIASDDDPLCDPWGGPDVGSTIDVASGEDDEFNDAEGHFSRIVALQIAVSAVRGALLRNACQHEIPDLPEHRYCRVCGVALADAVLWRWSSTASNG
jgi:hypothetical protein